MATERLDVTSVQAESVPGWSFTGTSTVADVQDGVDANYIWSDTAGRFIRYNVGNTSLTGSETINHVTVHTRAKATGNLGSEIRVRILDSSFSFQDGAIIDTATGPGESWVNYTDQFTTAPGGGAWSVSELDGLLLQMNNRKVTFNQNQVTEFYVVVDYTEAGGGGAVVPTLTLLGVGL